MFDCAFKPARRCALDPLHGPRPHYGGLGASLEGEKKKTVNVPKEATVEEIEQESWRLGAKAVSIYRDGSKRTQPLNTSKDNGVAAAAAAEAAAATQPAPAAGRARLVHAQVRHCGARGLHHGRPVRGRLAGEIFLVMAKEGSTISGLRRRVRAGHHLRAAVRGAAAGAGGQVQPRPLRALGHDQEPRRPLRQVDCRLQSPAGWRPSSCRRRRSSAPASTTARRPSRRRRAIPLDVAAGNGDRHRHRNRRHRRGPVPVRRRCRTRRMRRRADRCVMVRSGSCYKCSQLRHDQRLRLRQRDPGLGFGPWVSSEELPPLVVPPALDKRFQVK